MSLKKIKKWLGHDKVKKEKDRKNPEEAKDLNFGIEFFTSVPAAPVLESGMDEITITKLTDDYFDKLKENYKEYMENALSGEISDWQNSENPDVDEHGKFLSSMPIFISQMVNESLQVAATISLDMLNKVFVLSLSELIEFGKKYKDAIVEYKNEYFRYIMFK